MDENRKNRGLRYYLSLIMGLIVPLLVIVACVILIPRLIMYFLPFVLAYLIAMLANPLVSFLQRKISIKRKHSSALVIVAVLVLLVILIYYLVTLLISICMSLMNDIPGYISNLTATIDGLFVRYSDFLEMLPEELSAGIMELRGNLSRFATDLISSMAMPTVDISVSAVRSVPGLFINVLIFFIAAFCYIAQWENVQQFIREHMPRGIAGYMDYLKNDVRKILGSWLKAQIKIMGVVFLVLAVAFTILRVDYGILLALLTAFLDFLPAFGVGFIMWPWIAIELLSGNFLMALWLGIVYILTQFVRNTLQPKIMGDTMGLSSLSTLLFLFLGYKFYGIAGMIFAVPIGMFCLSLYRYGLFDRMFAAFYELLSCIGDFFGKVEDKDQ